MMNRVHGGDIRRYSKKIIDFSANINPLGLPSGARRAIIKNITDVTSYPEPDSRSLKTALAGFHKIKAASLAVGNGSIELIYLIPRALGSKKILIVTPTFSEYEFAAKAAGARIVFFKARGRDDFRIHIKDLVKYIPRSDLVFLCNPNNPTGSSLSRGDLLTLANTCLTHKTALALDEAFMDFTEGYEKSGMMRMASGRRGLFVVRSLTKFFAMPGLRLGYCVGHPDSIRKISGFQYPWNVNALAQAAGLAALKDKSYIQKSKQSSLVERAHLFEALKDMKGLKTMPSTSNFILCRLSGAAIKSAKVLNRRLVDRGVVVRDCGNFRGLNEKYFRVAVRSRSENIKLIAALKGIL